jgi:hypothetical protein
MRLRRKRSIETGFAEFSAKATLTNLGGGRLELIDNTIKFYLEKGRFKKSRKIAREIPIADIERIKQEGKELIITWRGVTDIFVTEETDLVGIIYEKTNKALREQEKSLEDEEAGRRKAKELTKLLGFATEIVDSLFDILRSLQGQVNWNRTEGYLNRSEENVKDFMEQKMGKIELDFTKTSLALKEHLPEEISRETYSILKSLYGYFDGLASKKEALDQHIHPNYHDAKTIILAHYTLNDIILGNIVGDEEIVREKNQLIMTLQDLSREIKMEIDVNAIEDIINRLGMEKEKENIIEEIRGIFRQQLKELITV